MVITFKRWHWLLFACFWVAQGQYWRLLLSHSPDGPAVVHFLQSQGWQLVALVGVGMTAAYAFLTTIIVTQVLQVVLQGPKRH